MSVAAEDISSSWANSSLFLSLSIIFLSIPVIAAGDLESDIKTGYRNAVVTCICLGITHPPIFFQNVSRRFLQNLYSMGVREFKGVTVCFPVAVIRCPDQKKTAYGRRDLSWLTLQVHHGREVQQQQQQQQKLRELVALSPQFRSRERRKFHAS